MTAENKQKAILELFEEHFGMSHATALFENVDFLVKSGNGPKIDPVFLPKLKNSSWMFRNLAEEFLALNYDENTLKTDVGALEVCLSLNSYLSEILQGRLFGIELNYIDAISGERYESASAASNQLILVPDQRLLNSYEITLIPNNQRVDVSYEKAHALRKLLNMARKKCLVLCKTGTQFQAVGFAPRKYMRFFPSILFQGHMAWSFCVPDFKDAEFVEFHDSIPIDTFRDWVSDHTLIRFHNERFLFPLPTYHEFEKRYWEDRLKDLVSSNCASTMADEVTKIMFKLKPRDNALLLILSDDETMEAIVERLCKTGNRGFWLDPAVDAQKQGEYLEQFCKIDGAILMDLSGKIHAYGVILDGLFAVNCETADEQTDETDCNTRMTMGDLSRGSRYNSGRLFAACEAQNHPEKPIFSIIVSEDGMSECELTVYKHGKLQRYPEMRPKRARLD